MTSRSYILVARQRHPTGNNCHSAQRCDLMLSYDPSRRCIVIAGDDCSTQKIAHAKKQASDRASATSTSAIWTRSAGDQPHRFGQAGEFWRAEATNPVQRHKQGRRGTEKEARSAHFLAFSVSPFGDITPMRPCCQKRGWTCGVGPALRRGNVQRHECTCKNPKRIHATTKVLLRRRRGSVSHFLRAPDE